MPATARTDAGLTATPTKPVVRPLASVPLVVQSPERSDSTQPVTIGLPFPKGVLSQVAPTALCGPDGQTLGCQVAPLAHWSDGSIKWLLLDFVLPSVPAGESRLSFDPQAAADKRSPNGPELRVTERADTIEVDTGTTVFHVARTVLAPLRRVTKNGSGVVVPDACRVVLTDQSERRHEARVERAVVEAAGPVRATVRLEGSFPRRVGCSFVARLGFYAGTGLVRLRLTLHNPNRARHRGGLWDLGDPSSVLFRELALEFRLQTNGQTRLSWSAEPGQTPRTQDGGALEIYQDSSGGDRWQSYNHVNRLGQVPCAFRGYRVTATQEEMCGLRASPTVHLRGAGGSVGVAVPEFWQQFPKALTVEGANVRVGLFPRQSADLFELQGGEQKTHTVWLDFGAETALASALDWTRHPAVVRATPEWYAASGALPSLPAWGSGDGRLDGVIAGVIDGPNSFFAGREVIDEFGWRHFGEVYADHEAAYYEGREPFVSHFNNQYDVVDGLLLQFLRSGDRRWWELLDPLARHVIDIDIYHTDRDKSAYNGGLFWFTDHYKTAHTATHRTYSRHNCQPGDRSYGGGPSSNHNFTTGLLHYYYLTGEPAARDAVRELADWVVNMDDGTKTVFGVLDPGPTGLASCTRTLDYQGPGRGPGFSINALLDAWLLTGARRYLDQAEVLIRRCIHPADAVEEHDLLNVEEHWSYTIFLVILARYLDVKAEASEIDERYAYARAALSHYARWMFDNEVPYFDHPEKLEYPTDVWAAQELRKANVLRLAAAHAPEPWRDRLRERGRELAERGWSDLFRFPEHNSARTAAILMTDGLQDLALQAGMLPAVPSAVPEADFGHPEHFVPQKLRVMTRLKTVRGLAGALFALVRMRNCRRLLFGVR
jgi:hypothetical protein